MFYYVGINVFLSRSPPRACPDTTPHTDRTSRVLGRPSRWPIFLKEGGDEEASSAILENKQKEESKILLGGANGKKGGRERWGWGRERERHG